MSLTVNDQIREHARTRRASHIEDTEPTQQTEEETEGLLLSLHMTEENRRRGEVLPNFDQARYERDAERTHNWTGQHFEDARAENRMEGFGLARAACKTKNSYKRCLSDQWSRLRQDGSLENHRRYGNMVSKSPCSEEGMRPLTNISWHLILCDDLVMHQLRVARPRYHKFWGCRRCRLKKSGNISTSKIENAQEDAGMRLRTKLEWREWLLATNGGRVVPVLLETDPSASRQASRC